MPARKSGTPTPEAEKPASPEKETVTVTNAAIVPLTPAQADALLPVFMAPAITVRSLAKGKKVSIPDGEATLSTVVTRSQRTLDDLEDVVRDGLTGLIQAGIALLEIRTYGLFKERKEAGKKGYTSFIKYAQDTFKLSTPRIYQLVDIAQVAAILTDAGRALPAAGNVLSALAPEKGDPKALVQTFDKATQAAGGAAKVRRENVVPLVQDNARAKGKTPGKTAPKSRNGKALGSRGRVPTGPRSSSSDLSDKLDRVAGAAAAPEAPKFPPHIERLRSFLNDLTRDGSYKPTDDQATQLMQSIAGAALNWLAGSFTNGQPGYANGMVITKTFAKGIVEAVRKEQAKAKSNGQNGSSAKVTEVPATEMGAAFQQAVAQKEVKAAEAKKATGPTGILAKADANLIKEQEREAKAASAAVTYAQQPTTVEEADAILLAPKGAVTGTQQRRAKAVMDAHAEAVAKTAALQAEHDKAIEAEAAAPAKPKLKLNLKVRKEAAAAR